MQPFTLGSGRPRQQLFGTSKPCQWKWGRCVVLVVVLGKVCARMRGVFSPAHMAVIVQASRSWRFFQSCQ